MTPRRLAPALCLALACASPQATTSSRPADAGAPTPPAPARPAYGDDAPAKRSLVEQELLGELQRALSGRGAKLLSSPALDRAARALAAAAQHGEPEPLARRSVERALRAGAAFDPAPVAHLASGPRDEVFSALLARIDPGEATTIGLAVQEGTGVHHVAVLLSRRRARLDPFPSTVQPGAEARLAGELFGLQHPRVFVTRPDGSSAEVEVEGGRAFGARVRFPVAGRYDVELTGTGAAGPEVAALLSVEAGSVAPTATPTPLADPADPADLGEAERRVVAAANRLRAAHSLPPLVPTPALAALARAHSDRMLAAGRVAHVLPGSPEVAERLVSARLPFRRVYENVARGESGLSAHAAAEASPAHRTYLLAPDAAQVGVGLARGRLRTGEPIVYLTEILVEPTAATEPDRLTPDARVREALWRERERRALPPLTNDSALEALAREAAESLRAGSEADPAAVAAGALRLGRGLAAADAFVASAPEEALRSRNLTDRRFTRVGVGVVTGESRRFGPGRLFIAVIYSD